jgi:hypothetical protein
MTIEAISNLLKRCATTDYVQTMWFNGYEWEVEFTKNAIFGLGTWKRNKIVEMSGLNHSFDDYAKFIYNTTNSK